MPLVKKGGLISLAKNLFKDLQKYWMVQYDEVASIGKRYRRQDEIGTFYAVTIDFETIRDRAVTVRDRDTMKQERIKIEELTDYLKGKLK